MLFGKKKEKEPVLSAEEIAYNRENKLYIALNYAALLLDLNRLNGEIADNEPIDTNTGNQLKDFWNKNVVNNIRKSTASNISDHKNIVLDRIENFKNQYKEEDYKLGEDIDELELEINEFFKDDKYNAARIAFAIRFAFDDSFEYEEKEETLKFISGLLFDDASMIKKITTQLESNYNKLNKNKLDTTKKVFIGVAAGCAVVALVAIGGTFAIRKSANVAQCVANIFGKAPGWALAQSEVLETIGFGAIVAGAAIGAGVHQAMIDEQKERYYDAFRHMSSSEMGQSLALKVTMYQLLKDDMDENESKDYVNDILTQADDFRSDAEYLLLVEKTDATNCKNKINVCNNLTYLMCDTVGI